MARIRSIKPEFWSSDQILDISPIARLAFIGLWNFCDDAGRHKASCRQLKAEVFPADAFDEQAIHALVDELVTSGLLLEYQVDGARLWQVTGWHHQKIDRPKPSKYPGPDAEGSESIPRQFDEQSTTDRRSIDDRSSLIGSDRRDRKGSDRRVSAELENSSSPPPNAPVIAYLTLNGGTQHPIDEIQAGVWAGQYPYLDIEQELQKMAAWLDANPAKRKTPKGINRFVVNWLNKTQDNGRGR